MILVIGDSCIDKFVYCNIDRICPEAPVPVMNPIKTTVNPGMAANVHENLKSLGVKVDLITNLEKITKTRYVDKKSGQIVVRIDKNDTCKRIKIEDKLTSISWDSYDAVIISDYCKGFLLESDIKYISLSHPLTFLDTKKKLGNWCQNISFIKINDIEYTNTQDTLQDLNIQDKIIVTKGGDGAEYKGVKYSTKKCAVKDLSGAGDTFLAGLVCKYIESKNIPKAIKFANNVASEVVQKQGVSVVHL